MSSDLTYEYALHSSFSAKERKENEDSSAWSEDKLWIKFLAGHEDAFARIYSDYADHLYSYGMKLVNNRERVMDAIQDLFTGMWESRERLGEVKSIKAYLFISLRRKVFSNSKKERKVELIGDNNALFLRVHTPSSEQNLIEREQLDKEYNELSNAMASLNARQKEIVYLKFYARLSYDDIAGIMEIDKKASYNLMARTLERLKQVMGGMLAILFLLSVLKT